MKKRHSSCLLNTVLYAMTCSGLFAFGIASAWAQQPQSGYYYGPHHMWGGGWSGMILGPFLMIVFIAITVVVVVLIVRWLGGTSNPGQGYTSPASRDPLDILKERYARGEIEKEEYEERKRVLRE